MKTLESGELSGVSLRASLSSNATDFNAVLLLLLLVHMGSFSNPVKSVKVAASLHFFWSMRIFCMKL